MRSASAFIWWWAATTAPRAAPIRHAVWLYFRFSLSFRDVEELMAASGIDVSYETIRCWTIKFGPQVARRLKRLRPSPSPRWHLDEMVCLIGGKRMFLWRAVDDEGEVLDLVVKRRRDKKTALTLLKRLLRNQPVEPERIVTDGLRSYPAALEELGLAICIHPADFGRTIGRQLFKSQASAQHFLATHAAIYNTFYTQRHLFSRPTLRRFRAGAEEAWVSATA